MTPTPGLIDDRLHPALNKISRLKAAELTTEQVGADFLRRHIASLQKRDRFAWEYGNSADMMRLYPGLINNLSIYGHGWLCEQLFSSLGSFHLPARVVPLHLNSARDQILKWMQDCNAYGVEAD